MGDPNASSDDDDDLILVRDVFWLLAAEDACGDVEAESRFLRWLLGFVFDGETFRLLPPLPPLFSPEEEVEAAARAKVVNVVDDVFGVETWTLMEVQRCTKGHKLAEVGISATSGSSSIQKRSRDDEPCRCGMPKK